MSSKMCMAWVRPEPLMPVMTTMSGTRAAISAERIFWPWPLTDSGAGTRDAVASAACSSRERVSSVRAAAGSPAATAPSTFSGPLPASSLAMSPPLVNSHEYTSTHGHKSKMSSPQTLFRTPEYGTI